MRCFKSLFILLAIAYSALLTSCGGGGGAGGGAGELKTVYLVPSISISRLESDVNTGTDCSVSPPIPGTYATDTVDVTISSNLYPNITSGKYVSVDSATITYTGANASGVAHPLPTDYLSITGATIAPGSNVSISVPVAKDILKYDLVNRYGLQLCSAQYYEYYVTITFDCLEIGTDKRTTVTARLNVAFADRAS